ncbi:hypothetical protein HYW75_01300 [Candidatus Pacearchaeota archaeon]|nr:hypothetical protein [Candidatus Pacearchaeota archaeon]
MMNLKIFIICIGILIFSIASMVNAQSGNNTITGKAITSEAITGEATSQTFGVSVYVIGLPALVLHNPKNQTYFYDKIFFNYSVSGASFVWYKLDNQTNVTINQTFYINVTQGNHTFFLYANNSAGHLVIKNINFSVNLTSFTIKNGKYDSQNSSNGNYSGNSTNFRDYSFSELQNLSNVIIENSHFGRIFFPVIINITDDANPNDGVIDIESYINISQNRIEINSSALPNFNKSATLRLAGLSFSNPRILFDGQECPASICTKESYSDGILSFNVSHFSTFSAEETTSSSQSSSSGSSSSGGGGGGSIIEMKSSKKTGFIVNKDRIKSSLKIGETRKEEIKITNNGDKKLNFNISQERLEGLLDIREKSFSLERGESKILEVDIIAREDSLPDTYVGKIIISSKEEEKEILVAIDISSKKSLFDVKLEIPKKFQTISPGDDIVSITNLYSLGRSGRIDVNLDYYVKDEEGNIILKDEETAAVETQLEVVNEFNIPKNLKDGDYILYVKVKYEGEIAVASTTFNVSSRGTGETIPFFTFLKILLYLLIIVAIVTIMLLLYKIVQLITLDEKSREYMRTIKEKSKILKKQVPNNIIKKWEPKVELYYE